MVTAREALAAAVAILNGVIPRWESVQQDMIDLTADSITEFWPTWHAVVVARAELAAAVAVFNPVKAKWESVQQDKLDPTADSITVFWASWLELVRVRAIYEAALDVLHGVIPRWESVQQDMIDLTADSITEFWPTWSDVVTAREALAVAVAVYNPVKAKWESVQQDKVDSTADSITVFWATWQAVVDARAVLADATVYYEFVAGKWRAVQKEKVDSTADSITVFWATWINVLTARAILAAAVAYHAFVVGKWESVQDDKLFARSTDSDYALFILNYARAKRDIAQEAYDSAVNAYYLAVLTAAQTIDEAIALDAWNANEAVQRPILLARSNGKPAVLNAGSFTYTSDGRLKKNVVSMDGALDSLDSMCGVYHHWNDENQPDRAIGVIAQDVQQFYPELVAENSSGLLSVNYPKLAAVLLQSIKELKAMVLAVIERRKAAIANAQK